MNMATAAMRNAALLFLRVKVAPRTSPLAWFIQKPACIVVLADILKVKLMVYLKG